MRICYASSKYWSFHRIAQFHRSVIRRSFSLVASPQEADVVILHCEPFKYPAIYKLNPILHRRYVISCATWEASELPVLYQHGLRLVQEVWTPSRYCATILRKHHDNVVILPHPVHRCAEVSAEDQHAVDQILSVSSGQRYYLAVGSYLDKRKNLRFLMEQFARALGLRGDAKLIVKGVPGDPELPPSPSVLFVRSILNEGQLSCLYNRSHAYVSAHHSEGWGLTISDAIAMRVPVIATDYSGNTDYMESGSSMPLEYEERPIEPRDTFGLFTGKMAWAYPSGECLCEMLRRVHRMSDGDLAAITTRAAEVAEAYTVDVVSRMLLVRLSILAADRGLSSL